MTGAEFEKKFCEKLKHFGYWALNIPRNQSGAQPFDVIAFSKGSILALDCKVCSGQARFPLSRIEDNQWTAFKAVKEKTNAIVGIAVYYQQNVYLITYKDLLEAESAGEKSIPLDDSCWLLFSMEN